MRPGEGKRKGENVAVAQCPASCGELIQGWILGSEKLISCPVDWYSTVEVETGKPRNDEQPLSRAMVNQLLAHWGYPAALSQQIRITLALTGALRGPNADAVVGRAQRRLFPGGAG